LGEGC